MEPKIGPEISITPFFKVRSYVNSEGVEGVQFMVWWGCKDTPQGCGKASEWAVTSLNDHNLSELARQLMDITEGQRGLWVRKDGKDKLLKGKELQEWRQKGDQANDTGTS